MTRAPNSQGAITRKVHARPISRSVSGSTATVSVVIPCYNYADYLADAVTSVLTQVGVSVDVIIIDDHSTDGSHDVAQSLANSDHRVRVFRNSFNRGPVCTYNHGLEHVTGEFTVRLDADDMLTPGSLLRSTTLARQYPSVGLVYGHPVHFIETVSESSVHSKWGRPAIVAPSSTPPYRHKVKRWTIWPGRQWLSDRCRSGLNVITSPEVLMRTSVVTLVGGQRPLPHTHDMEMWMRIATAADIAYIEGADQAWHREHGRSLSGLVTSPQAELEHQQLAFDTLFGQLENSTENRSLLESAHKALAGRAVREASHQMDRGRATPSVIDSLSSYATNVYAGAARGREWRLLQARIALQRHWPVNRSPFALAAAGRRLKHEWAQARWERWGT
ncbi:glycosyltransferase family 2 protein [Streptomyces sp. SID6673]|nr:glycosyltransferase family 2 protein [Streptomyces sp. SID11726]NEB27408.1 glycosyltransferase family 2 protein [Streptomyces sp. SID6673]